MRRVLAGLAGLAVATAWACSGDDPGPSGAIVGTVLDSGSGAVGSVVRIVREAEGATSVGATSTEIFWLAGDRTIRAAKKSAPTDIRNVAERTAAVQAVAADEDGFYWVEGGELFALRGGAAESLHRGTDALDRVVVARGTVAATAPNDAGLVTVTARGAGVLPDVIADDNGLATDGTSVFFTRGAQDIVRLDLDGGVRSVVVGMNAPRELAVDGTRIYTSADIDGGKALFQLDKRANDVPGATVEPFALVPLLPDAGSRASLVLAFDGASLVYANRLDGTVFRVSDAGATSVTTLAGLTSLAADRDGVYATARDGSVVWAQR